MVVTKIMLLHQKKQHYRACDGREENHSEIKSYIS